MIDFKILITTNERCLILKKACQCKGSSSGPRLMFKEHKREEEIAVFTYAKMACDVCNKPWGEVS